MTDQSKPFDLTKAIEDELARLERQRESLMKISESAYERPIDEDGYPTEAALKLVELWSWRDPIGWFDFIRSIWWYPEWGWSEVQNDQIEGDGATEYHISTGGWSGNESIILAMMQNLVLWKSTWCESKRGGHYRFKVEREDNDIA